MISIWFKTDRNGKRRAYYLPSRSLRAFPIAIAKAELMIANGEAQQVAGNPLDV